MESLREMIIKRQNEVASGDLHPVRCAEILVEISALYGNILDEVRRRQMTYNTILLNAYDETKTANRPKLKAETTKEYNRLLRAKNLEKVTIEIIRALKYFLREKSTELKEAT